MVLGACLWNGCSPFYTPGIAPAKPGAPKICLPTLLPCPLVEISLLEEITLLGGQVLSQ